MNLLKSPRVILALTLIAFSVVGPMIAAERAASNMATAATLLLDSLTSAQRADATFELGSDEREKFHFIPTEMFPRNGVTIRDMTDEQRAYFIPRFLEDDTYFTTVAVHEPDTDLGYDYFTETPPDVAFRTRAVKQSDGSWLINGAKNFQTVGYLAKLIVTMAQTPDGPRAFLVEGDSEGLVRHPMSKIGRRVGDNAEIFYDNVRVPSDRILGPPPPGRTDMGTHVTIAWSPSLTWVTSPPTWVTTPVPSWPSTIGRGESALRIWWSCEWQMPLEKSLTMTWSGRGSGTSSSSTTSRCSWAVWIAAKVFMAPPVRFSFGS